MKEAFVDKEAKVEIRDSPIPKPAPGQILIQVVVSGTNPKDWKLPKWFGKEPSNAGDDIAGYVAALGEGVIGFKKGDRVAAFHEMMSPHGSFAEYAIAWDYSTFHLPESVKFEEAATLPLASMTAALGLYQRLRLPLPFQPATSEIPLVIYGGSSAVGAFAIKLAKASNIHPIIAVAGKGAPFVEDLIDRSKGDTIVDYRKGDEAVVEGIKTALGGKKLLHAFDATSEDSTVANISKVLDKSGALTVVLTPAIPEGINCQPTNVGSVHKPQGAPTGSGDVKDRELGDPEFGSIFFPLFTRGLAHGWFTPHPYEVVPGGLDGVQTALDNLASGKASAVKYVMRIADTKGAGQDTL